jgi:GTP diphosphokinase / guanosine-3',5'-bis(diphosphate) 3'-diphosphatase
MNRSLFFSTLADRLNSDELQYVQRAYWLVKEAHRRQKRRLTGERFFEHLRRVAFMAAVDYGYCDAETVALGLLHDIVEDTFVPQPVIVNLFGQQMYGWILDVSKEIPSFHPVTGKLIARAKLNEAAFYEALMLAHLKPRIVKGCDRVDNLKDLAQWEPARRDKYIIETNTYHLPLAIQTDARIANEIQKRLIL